MEQLLGVEEYEHYDYSIYGASFAASIGFTQRGCRLKCPFCVVPRKEGGIWRGEPYPRHLHLLAAKPPGLHAGRL